MNKRELIETLSEETGKSKAESGEMLNSLLEILTHQLSMGGDIRIANFGTFSVAKRNARQGVNPKNGEPITIEARNVVKFKVGKALKEAVN